MLVSEPCCVDGGLPAPLGGAAGTFKLVGDGLTSACGLNAGVGVEENIDVPGVDTFDAGGLAGVAI